MPLRSWRMLMVGLLALAPAVWGEEPTALVGADLSTWRSPHGEWLIAGEAAVDPDNPGRLITRPGTAVLVNGPTGKTTDLRSAADHGDIQAHVEFMVPKGSNSGVYFQGRYEVQILDSWGVESPKYSDCGGIYESADRKFAGRPPNVNASRAPGQWQSFDVWFRAPRFDDSGKKIADARFIKVVHNGVTVHENVDVDRPTRASPFSDEKPTGPLLLQGDHGPVAYRNIKIQPLADHP